MNKPLEWQEKEATFFAASLLMPVEWLKVDVKKFSLEDLAERYEVTIPLLVTWLTFNKIPFDLFDEEKVPKK